MHASKKLHLSAFFSQHSYISKKYVLKASDDTELSNKIQVALSRENTSRLAFTIPLVLPGNSLEFAQPFL